MPITIDRRGFLKASLSALAVPVLRGADSPAHVALLSDTHIAADPNDSFRGFSPHANLHKVSDMVSGAKPDLLVLNGDLARSKGEMQDYAAFNSYINPLSDAMPLVVTMGNHDDRENARKSLTKLTGDRMAVVQKLVTTLDVGPCVFVLLDSLLITGIAQGLLGKAQRAWLGTYLSEPASKPIVVFVHHNPDGDSDVALMDADRLLADLRPNKNVKALFFGHTHVYSTTKVDGLHLVNLPAVGYNFADGNPVGWTDTRRLSGKAMQSRCFASQSWPRPRPALYLFSRSKWRSLVPLRARPSLLLSDTPPAVQCQRWFRDGHVLKEGVYSRQPVVSSAGTVSAICLEMFEELHQKMQHQCLPISSFERVLRRRSNANFRSKRKESRRYSSNRCRNCSRSSAVFSASCATGSGSLPSRNYQEFLPQVTPPCRKDTEYRRFI
jgi:Icc protein